jgi:hypothetical protein
LTSAPELVLTFRNERPIRAVDLGEVFTSLARDYSRINKGRTLVVVRLETGSIVARLQEMYDAIAPYAQTSLEFLKAANNLRRFAEILKGLISKAKDHPEEGDLFRKKRRPGVGSAERLLRIAMDAGGEVEVRQRLPDGQEIGIKVTSLDAIKIREEAKALEHELVAASKQNALLFGNHLGKDLKIPALRDELVDKLVAASETDSGSAAVHALLGAVATALRDAGLSRVLETVAVKLEKAGHDSLAAAVRAYTKRGAPTSEPPLLT